MNMVKYYLQELPEAIGGEKKKVCPKMLVNRQISTKELVERIQLKSGVYREGIVSGMLMTLADTLVAQDEERHHHQPPSAR
mgnify:CR=1 FL=1